MQSFQFCRTHQPQVKPFYVLCNLQKEKQHFNAIVQNKLKPAEEEPTKGTGAVLISPLPTVPQSHNAKMSSKRNKAPWKPHATSLKTHKTLKRSITCS